MKPKVVLLGLDGLDLSLLQELIEQDQLPTFRMLLQDGAYGNLESYQPIISPLIWTSIATGRMPADHGILGFSYQQNQQTISIPSSKRNCAALWNITHHFNIPTTVLGWYATWPSETITGLIVSDRFVQSIHVADAGTLTQTLQQVTYPEETSYRLYDYRKEYTHIGCDELRTYINFDVDDCQTFLDTPFNLRDPVHHMRLILARAETYKNILLHQLQHDPSELTMALFDCTDTAAHLFMPFHPPKQSHITTDDYNRYHNAVAQIYKYADSLVQSILDLLQEDDILMIVSDHGFTSGDNRPVYSAETEEGNAVLWHRIQGTIIVYGNTIESQQIQNAHILDIAPTLLAMLNLPVSKEMPGKQLKGILSKSGESKLVDDWDHTFTKPKIPDTAVLNSIELERLQALGYAAGENDSDKQDSPDGLSIENHLNLSAFYFGQNQPSLALEEAKAAYALNPKHEKVLEHLSAYYINTKQYEEAIQFLLPLEEIITEKAELSQSNTDANKITSIQQSLTDVYSFLGEAYYSIQELSKAIYYFQRSINLQSNQPDILYNLGLCYGRTGQYVESEKTLESLLQIQPNHFNGTQTLAIAKLRQQKTNEARLLFLSIITEKPNDSNLHYLVGQCYDVEQNYFEAKQWYEKSIQLNPQFVKANHALQRLQKK